MERNCEIRQQWARNCVLFEGVVGVNGDLQSKTEKAEVNRTV